MKSAIQRPKGYRTITVEGTVWFWRQARGWDRVILINAKTGKKHRVDSKTLDRFQSELGHGMWDEYHECHAIEPRHISGIIKDILHWIPETNNNGHKTHR